MSIKIYNGSSWNPVTNLKAYTGSTWANAVKGWVYDGSSWNAFYPEFPAVVVAPTLSAAYPNAAGSTVSVTSNGTWSASPTSYTYAWDYKKWNGGSWASTGITASSMYVSSTYVAHALRCRIRATNGRGSTDTYVETGVYGPASLTGLTKTSTGTNTWSLSWSASYGAGGYYIQYGYAGAIPTTEAFTTSTSYNINATQYPTAPAFMGVLVIPVGPSSDGFPSAAYNYGYPGQGANG